MFKTFLCRKQFIMWLELISESLEKMPLSALFASQEKILSIWISINTSVWIDSNSSTKLFWSFNTSTFYSEVSNGNLMELASPPPPPPISPSFIKSVWFNYFLSMLPLPALFPDILTAFGNSNKVLVKFLSWCIIFFSQSGKTANTNAFGGAWMRTL